MALNIDVYNGDYGIVIRLDCKTDVSSALERYILIKKPDGTVVEETASQDGSNTDYIRYTVPSSNSPFATFGRYEVRAKILFSAGQLQQGDPAEIVVGESWTVT